MMIPIMLAAGLFSVTAMGDPKADLPFKNGQRVLILGDSNTYSGTWVQFLETYLFTHYPERKIEVINLGLPSETVSGLSEPDHPYPRPWLHERLDRALAKIKPDWVIACYGMNDGIYYPFSEDRFKAYQVGMRKLAEKVKSAHAKLILLTPMPFGAAPVRTAVRPATAERFSWVAPYEKYDDVLLRYAEWLKTSRLAPEVIDIHTPLLEVLGKMREMFPAFHFADDGVHLNTPGYLVWTAHVLASMKVLEETGAVIDAASSRVVSGAVSNLRVTDREVAFDWTARPPVPAHPDWGLIRGVDPITAWLSNLHLHVSGLQSNKYSIYEGSKYIGGIDFSTPDLNIDFSIFLGLSAYAHGEELMLLVKERERLLAHAWLTEIGHKRPGIPAGKPLAVALPEAAAMEERIRSLAKPVTLSIRLVAQLQ